MYIRLTKNSRGQGYYHLVESYREDGKVKQKVLLSLGKVEDNRLEELLSAIGKHKEIFTALEAANSLEIENTYILGPLLILQHIFTHFGIEKILSEIAKKHSQLQFDYRRSDSSKIAKAYRELMRRRRYADAKTETHSVVSQHLLVRPHNIA